MAPHRLLATPYPFTAVAMTCFSTAAPSPGTAQVIPLRTVPVASGDQFLLLPSATLGMAGVRVAVDDSLADAWSNPAKGVLVAETAFLGSPTYYGIANEGGAGRSFPIAGLFAGSRWFGGVALALQQIDNTSPDDVFIGWIDTWPPRGERLSDSQARNLYASGYVGTRRGDTWSVGFAVSAASLDAMDGVDLLYSGSDRIEQSGSMQDLRVGVYRAGERDRLELVLLHSRISMEHVVTWTDWIASPLVWEPQRRVETHHDESRTWGAHAGWERLLTESGWRIGATGTMNRKTHPRIPNYQIQDIPRDPGESWAYEASVGFGRTGGPTTFGLDVALQPIWSETWQEADTADVTASGGRLVAGDRSIQNDFFFTNVLLRTGLAQEVGVATFQGGLELRNYAYTLEQVDHVEESYREQDEAWMEWTPTLGVALRFPGIDLRYALRVTTGTGRPGTDGTLPVLPLTMVDPSTGDFLVAPSGALTLQDADVVTHQLAVRVPVR